MDFFMIVSLLGGLALFLYGMSMLGSGLEKLSGGRLEQTLEKLTNNVFKGVLLGALVPAPFSPPLPPQLSWSAWSMPGFSNSGRPSALSWAPISVLPSPPIFSGSRI